tara:strand:- start:11257 stop:12318 length:1062 start_codon:yes stop_codon:yes gene_type:complete
MSNLEQISELGELYINRERIFNFSRRAVQELEHMYFQVKDLNFTPSDLTDYIKDNCFRELPLTYDHEDDKFPSDVKNQILGLYSGALLHRLNELIPNLDYSIDGEGKSFPHLFKYAHVIGNLHIKNFHGHGIAEHIAAMGGEAGSITIDNCHGTYMGSFIARDKGKVQAIDIRNCTFDYSIGQNIGYCDGIVGKISIDNCQGDSIVHGIGCDRAKIDQVSITNCIGNSIGKNMFTSSGKGKSVIIKDCIGHDIGVYMASDDGSVKEISIVNCKGDRIGQEIGAIRTLDRREYGSYKEKWAQQRIFPDIDILKIANCSGDDLGKEINYHTVKSLSITECSDKEGKPIEYVVGVY